MTFLWLAFVVITLIHAAPIGAVDNTVVSLEKDHINPQYTKSGLIQTNATTNSNIFYWLAEAQRYSIYNING